MTGTEYGGWGVGGIEWGLNLWKEEGWDGVACVAGSG